MNGGTSTFPQVLLFGRKRRFFTEQRGMSMWTWNARLLNIPLKLQELYNIKNELDARIERTQIMFLDVEGHPVMLDLAILDSYDIEYHPL